MDRASLKAIDHENRANGRRGLSGGILLLSLLFLGAEIGLSTARAQPSPVPSPPAITASGHILIDTASGHVLSSARSNERVAPASITKLMTSYVVFHELRQGNISLDDVVTVSEKAWRTEGSRMFIEVNTQVSIEDLVKGMIIQSGNDACVALAEFIAGSEETFASLMNQYAQALELDDTHFMNSTGLPDEAHYTTAEDIAKLSMALISEFPDYYAWYSEKEFTFNGIRQHNRNSLLWRDPAVDGLKTGHTDDAGYCLASSAERNGMRLISVVMGADSERARADDSQKLLNYGFRFFETHRLYRGGQTLTSTEVYKGETDSLPVGLKNDLYITIARGRYKDLEAEMDIPSLLTAPIPLDSELGEVRVTLDGESVSSQPLFSLAEVPEGGLWARMTDSIRLWFHDDEG